MLNLQEILNKRKLMFNYPIPMQDGFHFIDMNNVYYVEADSSYTSFYFENNKFVTSSKNIGFHEKELEYLPFIRIHASYMVNLNRVKKYVRADDGYIILQNDVKIKVARSKKDVLLKLFKSFTS